MRYVISSETHVKGPMRFEAKLPKPKEPFQDIAVLAMPSPKSDCERMPDPKVRCTPLVENAALMFDGDLETDCPFPAGAATKDKPWVIDLETASPFTARSLALHPGNGNFTVQCELHAVEQNGTEQIVKTFTMDRRGLGRPQYSINVGFMIKGAVVVSFPAITSRHFRLVFSHVSGDFMNPDGKGALAEIVLSAAARVERIVEKQLGKVFPTPEQLPDVYIWPSSPEPESRDLVIAPKEILNVTDRLDGDGVLQWEVPKGEWIIMRTGMTTTGAVNHPTTDQGRGLECDKMSRRAIEAHFNGFMGRILARIPESDRAALKRIVIDSYEVGSQNWTDGMDESFRAAFGYDPRPWLPVLSGRIIGSAEQSDRFLWDFRRHVADRIAEHYVGGLRDIANKNGLRLWLENYGHWGFPAEFLQYGGQSDDLSGEFWVRENAPVSGSGAELRAAASAAHIYGKRVVSAEAFTSARSFMDAPANIKPLGDWAYCQGINHFVLHVYIQQPWQDRKPGVNAWFGTEFNRHNTWFEESKTWIDYLRRCHYMLQQGINVADVAYFIGEDAPKMIGGRIPELPAGYGYDYINADVLINRIRVQKGRLVLPEGTSYSMLVLPPRATMRPEMLTRIRDLVSQGAAVFGPPPDKSPSLQNYPACDAQVRRLSAELWGDLEHGCSKGLGQRRFKHGTLFCGDDLAGALRHLDVEPAITCPPDILWSHRRDGDVEIFFLSNQQDCYRLADISFRNSGRVPELWHPDSGHRESLAWYETSGKRTRIPISFDPYQSVFIVFRKPADKFNVVQVKRNELALRPVDERCPVRLSTSEDGSLVALVNQAGRYTLTGVDHELKTIHAEKLPAPLLLQNQWTVTFPTEAGLRQAFDLAELVSWSEHENEAVRFFSGTATYETSLAISPDLLKPGRHLSLDLGDVRMMAHVYLNGEDLGVLWKKPFAADITAAVKPGPNRLRIDITNTWWNRLVGEEKLPREQRKIFTTAPSRVPRKEPVPAGLLGPVTLWFAETFSVN
jgi:hypothetical protein